MSLFIFFLWILYFPLNLEYFRLFSGTEMAHTPAHILQMVRFSSSRSTSLQSCGNSCSEVSVSDVPLQYSNWEILVSLSDPFIFDGGTWTLWWFGRLLSSEGGIMRGGESLLFMSFRLYLTTSEYHTFIPIGFQRCLFSINVSGNLPLLRT